MRVASLEVAPGLQQPWLCAKLHSGFPTICQGKFVTLGHVADFVGLPCARQLLHLLKVLPDANLLGTRSLHLLTSGCLRQHGVSPQTFHTYIRDLNWPKGWKQFPSHSLTQKCEGQHLFSESYKLLTTTAVCPQSSCILHSVCGKQSAISSAACTMLA